MYLIVILCIGAVPFAICMWMQVRAFKSLSADVIAQIKSDTKRLTREWTIVSLCAIPAWLVVLTGIVYIGKWPVLPVPLRPTIFLPAIVAEIYRMHRTSLLAWPRKVMVARMAISVLTIAIFCGMGCMVAFGWFLQILR